MPYLTVLGDGSWRYRRDCFRAGVHEVTDAVAAAAVRSGINHLVVTTEAPTLAKRAPGPLTLAEVRDGTNGGGVRIAAVQPTPPTEAAPEEEPIGVPAEFPCLVAGCLYASPDGFPSKPALDRHTEFNHMK